MVRNVINYNNILFFFSNCKIYNNINILIGIKYQILNGMRIKERENGGYLCFS